MGDTLQPADSRITTGLLMRDWIPAFAGMTKGLDSRLRGNGEFRGNDEASDERACELADPLNGLFSASSRLAV
jgi:hypothetical protein